MQSLYELFLFLFHTERRVIIQEAITEAKEHAMEKEHARKVKAQTASSGHGRISSKHYKQMTKEARRQGEARELLEGMVRKAERKLAEQQKQSHAQVQSAEERAEELATELFHKPGSLLTEEEVSYMVEESGCIESVEFEELLNCFTSTFQIYRTIDGTCNNLENPFLGAADTALVRLIPAEYEDGISSLRGGLQNREASFFSLDAFTPPNPSARHVSQTVIRDINKDESLTHILMQWGQFIDHDLSLSPELEDECPERAEHCEFTTVCESIRVTDLDPVFGLGTPNNGSCLPFSRSLAVCADPTFPIVTELILREQINVLTSFIDGSMIYGSDDVLAIKLRELQGGLLREGSSISGKKAELPRVSSAENMREEGVFVGCPNPGNFGCFLAGDFRVNEQISLTTMHTLWLREHNRIAGELAVINPSWDDERLYQEARKIVGALIQKITYYDYLPKILGKEVYNIVIGEFIEYDPRVNPGVTNAFSTAAYRYGHTLIRPFFDRLGSNYSPIAAGPLDLFDAFFNPDQFRNGFGTDPILRGLVTQNSRRVDEFMSAVLTNNLFRQHLDLASLNIQRGRDHGIPPYLTWQRFCQRIFPELEMTDFTNTLTLIRFLEIYGSLDTVDLWIGGLAEDRLPGSLLGPTFACLFGITFANIRNGDRFYYKAEGVFEPAQVASIHDHTLSSVICDNSDGINTIQADAFLSGQQRVRCNKIPRINLQLWQEEMCYYRLDVSRRPLDIDVHSFSRNEAIPSFSPFSATVPGNLQDTESLCIPMVCPTAVGPSEVIFYVDAFIILQEFFTLQINPELPDSVLPVELAYNGYWPDSLFSGTRDTGLYRSLGTCQQGNSAAFTLASRRTAPPSQRPSTRPPTQPTVGPPSQRPSTRPPTQPTVGPPSQRPSTRQRRPQTQPTVGPPFSSVQQTDAFDSKILEQLEEMKRENSDIIPEDLLYLFMREFGGEGEGEGQAVSEIKEMPSSDTVSDAQLMSDLEKALKSLNV